MSRDHCPDCGATYTDDEFGTDGDGHLICWHECDPGTRAMFKVPVHASDLRKLSPKECAHCRSKILAGVYCARCASDRRRQQQTAWYKRQRRSA